MLRCDLSIAVVNLVKPLSVQLSQCSDVLQEQGAVAHLVFGSSSKHLHPTQFFKIDYQTALWKAVFSTEQFSEHPKLFTTIEIAFKRLELYATKLA